MVCSFLATLILGVQNGVVAAMGFSLLLFVSKSSRPRIAELGRVFGEILSIIVYRPLDLGLGIAPGGHLKAVQ